MLIEWMEDPTAEQCAQAFAEGRIVQAGEYDEDLRREVWNRCDVLAVEEYQFAMSLGVKHRIAPTAFGVTQVPWSDSPGRYNLDGDLVMRVERLIGRKPVMYFASGSYTEGRGDGMLDVLDQGEA